MIVALFACAIGAHARLTGAAHSAPYVLIWSSQENLEEYDAGLWPTPSQILRRSTVADNDTPATVLACRDRQIFVLALRGRAHNVSGWVNRDELAQGANVNAALESTR